MSRTTSVAAVVAGLAILAAIVFFSLRGAIGERTDPARMKGISVQGYRIVSSLPGGQEPGSEVKPQDPASVFVAVTVSVAAGDLLPSESEYAKLRDIFSKYSGAEGVPRREDMRQFQSDRFTLLLKDGTEFGGQLIAGTNYLASGYSPSATVHKPQAAGKEPDDLTRTAEELEVVFVVDGKIAKPPFRIRFKAGEAMAVPAAGTR